MGVRGLLILLLLGALSSHAAAATEATVSETGSEVPAIPPPPPPKKSLQPAEKPDTKAGAKSTAKPAAKTGDSEYELLMPPGWVLESLNDVPIEILYDQPLVERLPGIELPEWHPPDKPPPKIWELRVEFGLNGSDGNSERFSTRYGSKVRRKTPVNVLTLDLLYSTSYANGKLNEDKALFEAKSEWPFQGSAWHAYARENVEYDRFTAFDVRLTSNVGLGYEYVNTNVTKFQGRLGAGFSQELGGREPRIVPEGSVGFTYEHQLTPRQKLLASADMFHDVTDFNDFRVRSNASWEIKIDPPARLSLRLGVIDRYDSTPGGRKRNDLDYSTLIVWEW